MFNKTKVKLAAKQVNNKQKKQENNKRTKFWGRLWNIICAPFRFIKRIIRKVWNWISEINLIGLINTTLLIAIIVLFSMLILDITRYNSQKTIVVAEPVQVVPQVQVLEESAPNIVKKQRPTLPMRVDAKTNKRIEPAVNVVPVSQPEVKIAEKQTAKQDNNFWGDVIIDTRGAGAMLKNGAKVNGNLYLQNMRKYTLPCDIRINGNLFLRDVNMLQFCGDFVITGNIYVSPRSSFGPIPQTAKLGGYVVL